MSKPARASQSDIKRAISAVAAVSIAISKIEIDVDGNIAIYTSANDNTGKEPSGWEDLE